MGVVGEASCQFLKRSVKKTRSLTKAFCHSRQPGYLLHLTPLLPLVSSSTTDALMGRGGGGKGGVGGGYQGGNSEGARGNREG